MTFLPRTPVALPADAPAAPEPLAMAVVDSHTHLDVHDRRLHGDDAPDIDTMIAAAADVGVTRLVQIGCDVASAQWSVEMAQTRPTVIVGVALHPNDAARMEERDGRQALEDAWAEIARLAADPVVRIVGETGLDYFRTAEAGRSVQHESFRWHIGLAKQLDKVLVIHDRESHDDVLSILEDEGAPDRVVFHCFSGDAVMARHCAERGWFMSFAGNMTYPSAQSLRDALAVVPDELLLVETDAPYLTPVPSRGRPNASYLMPHTVRAIAAERHADEAGTCALLWDNAQRVFGAW